MLGHNTPIGEFPGFDFTNEIMVAGHNLGHELHGDTLLLSWLCMGTILLGAAVMRSGLTAKGPGTNGQGILEMVYEFVADITKGQIGHDWKTYFPLIAGIFIFVLIANFSGILPWQAIGSWIPGFPTELHEGHRIPAEIAAPSTDINVTFGLALVALLTYVGSGFAVHKLKYLKLYINPIEWMDLVIRPATLSLRLMMVITADELMRGAALMMVPVLLPAGVMSFEMFIGVIQAFVFALLTAIYIGLTVSHH